MKSKDERRYVTACFTNGSPYLHMNIVIKNSVKLTFLLVSIDIEASGTWFGHILSAFKCLVVKDPMCHPLPIDCLVTGKGMC